MSSVTSSSEPATPPMTKIIIKKPLRLGPVPDPIQLENLEPWKPEPPERNEQYPPVVYTSWCMSSNCH